MTKLPLSLIKVRESGVALKLYRSHRGTLDDSMETVIEVDSLKDLSNKLDIKGKLTCKWYCKDDRIGWDTWLVCEDGAAIGMSNGELK